MGFLRKILGFLFVSAVLTAVTAYVIDGRLLNFSYLNQKAGTDKIYTQIAETLPDAFNSSNDNGEAAATLKTIITPDYVQTKLGGFLDQMQAYYNDNGPAPVLDLRDLAAKAGIDSNKDGSDNPFQKPIVFQDPGIKQPLQQTRQAKLYAPLAAVLLLILIMLTLPSPARYKSAGKTVMAAAVSVGLLFATFKFLPNILEPALKTNKDITALTPTIMNVVRAVTGDMAQDLLAITIGLVVLAGGFFLLGMTGGFGRFLSKSGKTEVKRPTPDKRLKLN